MEGKKEGLVHVMLPWSTCCPYGRQSISLERQAQSPRGHLGTPTAEKGCLLRRLHSPGQMNHFPSRKEFRKIRRQSQLNLFSFCREKGVAHRRHV